MPGISLLDAGGRLLLTCRLFASLPEGAAEPLGDALPTLLGLVGSIDTPLPLSFRAESLEACIKCLEAAGSLPSYTLLPYKRRVLRTLEPALDHKKRCVRQAACRCANQWHLLGKK